MTELSDYQRLCEAPMVAEYERRIREQDQAISTLTAEVEASIEAFEAIKEFADADDAFLCWKTANDALATLTKGEGDKPSNTQEIEP